MTETKLVSVVVPSYCHEDYILDCLLSIHDQTHRDVELVVVDDKSRDQSFERVEALVATRFANRFVNTIVVRNEVNLGAHATIDKGIAMSHGRHVAVINSDDLYHPHRIEALMAALADSGSELGFTLVDILSDPAEMGEIPEFFRLFTLRQRLDLERDRTIGFSLLRANRAVSTGNMLFSRRLYEKAGPFLPLKYCHDWDFVLQALYHTEPAVVMEPLYHYRLHGTNSFSALAHVANVETEVVIRRFFRRGLTGRSENPLFPSAANWPGYFELFVRECGYEDFLRRENGDGGRSWRTYEKGARQAAAADHFAVGEEFLGLFGEPPPR